MLEMAGVIIENRDCLVVAETGYERPATLLLTGDIG